MLNKQFEEVEELAADKNINLRICPTCRQPKIEVAPGIWEWEASTYRLYGEEHECECKWQDTLRRHYLLAGIPSDYWTLSDEDFFGDKSALQEMQQYLQAWTDWKWHGIGLEFYSPIQGTGKTMLATLIAKDLIQRGERVHFTSFRDAIRLYDMPYEAREERTRLLRHTPVLILDEVGLSISAQQGAFFATELEDLVRFRTSGNGVTLITTNLAPDQLDHEYPRTFSLLAAKQRRIKVNGADARRSGDVDLVRMELIANKEARPIV